jgi:hypothetical protein
MPFMPKTWALILIIGLTSISACVHMHREQISPEQTSLDCTFSGNRARMPLAVPASMVGIWRMDGYLNESWLRRHKDVEMEWMAAMYLISMMDNLTLTVTDSEIVMDSRTVDFKDSDTPSSWPGMHSVLSYKTSTIDHESILVQTTDKQSGEANSISWHFEGPNIMWLGGGQSITKAAPDTTNPENQSPKNHSEESSDDRTYFVRCHYEKAS